MVVIYFKKTVVGWYNFTFATFKYNVDPLFFRELTGISEQASLGTCQMSLTELGVLKEKSIYLGQVEGWGRLKK